MRISNIKKWSNGAYWLFLMLYLETLAHAGMYGQFRSTFWFALGFSGAIALVLGALVSFLPKKALFPLNLVLTIALTLLYGSQMVYFFIFKTPYSVSQMGLGANAVTSFWREMLGAMKDNWPWILAMPVPLIVLILLRKLADKPGFLRQAVLVILAAAVAAGTGYGIRAGGTGMYTNYYFFTSTKATTNQIMERFGVPMTFLLELLNTEEPASGDSDETDEPVLVTPVPVETTVPPAGEEAEEAKPPVYNVLDVDFDALNESTENNLYIMLDDYISQLPGTMQNEYTGMLKDYNLILICAESFSPAAVDPEVTPTLYKLTHEGFVFNNYYNSFPNTTIDGEYALTQGLWPDPGRGKYESSMLTSSDNYLPFTLGNIFREQRSIESRGYHNYLNYYFGRYRSHPNMGYDMKFAENGMKFTNEWPASDLEMMEQSVDDYIHDPQFHAYYMTFSGHYRYETYSNGIAAKNYHLVEDLPLAKHEQKAYLACNIELDMALEYLMNRLEEEGVLEKTAIVMAGDHFPYGLPDILYFDMIGEDEDYFRRYKSNLVFWVGGMEEPVEVDTYCCNVDILPTILNLWGFEYDSRMLAGTDIFSDSPHMAVIVDHSFLTDKVWFNTNTGDTRYQVPESEIPEDYIEKMHQLISSRFDLSASILRGNYYGFAFGKS